MLRACKYKQINLFTQKKKAVFFVYKEIENKNCMS